MCRVSGGWWGERLCDYGDGTYVRSGFHGGRREFEIVMGLGEVARRFAYEALYSAVLSAVGEELDLRGFHRAHGLGIEMGGKRALLLLPSGGGKSAIAALLCRRPGVRIYSDESPLLRDSRMFAFPVRGALRPEVARALGIGSEGPGERIFRRKLFPEKLLYRFDPARVAEPARPDWILVGFKNGMKGGAIRRSLFAKLAAFAVLLDSCVVGRGLAQMSEYMVRGDSIWKLPKIAFLRFFAVFFLIFRSRCAWIHISDDAHQNTKVLSDFLTKPIL
jgi:hypothetical protein